jgi:hypothetical protein
MGWRRTVIVEQKLGACEVCGRTYALQYEYNPLIQVDVMSEIHTLRWARCPVPGCGHQNPVMAPLYVGNVLVKGVVGPDPVEPRVGPNTLRRVWLSAPEPQEAPVRRRSRRGLLGRLLGLATASRARHAAPRC